MPKVYIHRSSEYANNARNIAIYVDGEKHISIPNGGSKALELAEGKHEIYGKIDWCYSPTLSLDLKENDKVKLELSSFKMAKWMVPLALFCALVYFIASFVWDVQLYWLGIIVVPIFLYQLYHLTFGRKKYLQLNIVP
ncbi:MAG: hypothetical protein N4A46_09395 [Schleiferiaceae bacterium]|jgi:hypothetical protein|nr:hypothetical protein [Schleiferiaceae bacterium]